MKNTFDHHKILLYHYRLNFIRNYKAIEEKLRAIHRLMNALHNMKTKDLRTRVPLSHEMVKFLYRHVPYERPAFR